MNAFVARARDANGKVPRRRVRQSGDQVPVGIFSTIGDERGNVF
jgi:hypothetical protein